MSERPEASSTPGGSTLVVQASLPARIADQGPVASLASGPQAWIERDIDDYHILRVIDAGGMGVVFLAEQRHPKRLVAIKTLHAGLHHPEMLARFQQEAEILGRLKHPGIAQIFASGRTDATLGLTPYIVMEYVEGSGLIDFCHDIGVRDRLAILMRVCTAVEHAHIRGVIHRDLKPGNILVNESGQPKILDFGVARLTDIDLPGTRQTAVGEVVGTLQYMSPEQVSGDPLDVDTRSDVYALGAILYELLADRLPYDLERRALLEALRVINTEDPPSLGSIDKGLRGDVETIVAKALEKDKNRRYGSALDLSSDIHRFLHDEPIAARPASAGYQIRKFTRRHRGVVGGLAAAAIALLVGTGASSWQALRARAAERLAETRRIESDGALRLADVRRAEAEAGRSAADSARRIADAARDASARDQRASRESATRANREAERASAVSGFLSDMLRSPDPDITRGRNLTVREMLDSAALRVNGERLRKQPAARAAAHATIAQSYMGVGVYASARIHAESAHAILKRLHGPRHLHVLQGARAISDAMKMQGDRTGARRFAEEALSIARALLPANHDEIADITGELATLAYYDIRREDAERLGREAVAMSRRNHPVADTAVRRNLVRLANILAFTGRLPEAESLTRESESIARRAYGDGHSTVFTDLLTLMFIQSRRGDVAGAEQTGNNALVIGRRLYGTEHPNVANVLERLGAALAAQRKDERAEVMQREALAMRIKLLGEGHTDVQLIRVALANTLTFRRKYAEAESLYTQALAGRRALYGEKHGAIAATLGNLGNLANARRDFASAERFHSEAVTMWKDLGIREEELNAMSRLARALQSRGKFVEAEEMLREVLRRQQTTVGTTELDVTLTRERLGSVLAEQGVDRPGAERFYLDALAIRRRASGNESPLLLTSLVALAELRLAAADTVGAEPYLRTAHAITRRVRPAGDPELVRRQLRLGGVLCAAGRYVAADSVTNDLPGVMTSLAVSDSALAVRAQGHLSSCTRAP